MTTEEKDARIEETRIKQPNSNDCYVCGLRNGYGLRLSFYETGPGEVMAEYTVPERYQGYPGVVHGGVVAAMLDEVLGRALMTGDHFNFWQTGRLTIRYRKNIPVGEPLRITGKVRRRKGKIAKSEAELRLSDGTLAAQAEGILARLPVEFTRDQAQALGWRVYPD